MRKISRAKIIIHLFFGCASIVFIGLYWCCSIGEAWRNVLMAIGASLIGAELLAGILELIDLRKKKSNKLYVVGDAVQAAKWLLEEITAIESSLLDESIFDFKFKDLNEFSKEAARRIYDLFSFGTEEAKKEAREMQATVDDIINTQTYIVARCNYAVSVFQRIVDYKPVLFNTGQLNQFEIELFETSVLKIKYFLKIWNERNYVFIATNDINFVDELKLIVEMQDKTIDKCTNCKYRKHDCK